MLLCDVHLSLEPAPIKPLSVVAIKITDSVVVGSVCHPAKEQTSMIKPRQVDGSAARDLIHLVIFYILDSFIGFRFQNLLNMKNYSCGKMPRHTASRRTD